MVSAGAPVQETVLNCCPHTERLRLALEQAGETFSLTERADSLQVRSDTFFGPVPLCNPVLLRLEAPDAKAGDLSNEFRAALQVVRSLVRESAKTVLHGCVQLNNGSVCATDGIVILERWHGCGMPGPMRVPKAFVDAVCKSKLKIEAFGFTDKSFTVWFADGFWIKTQLFSEEIPDMLAKLEYEAKPQPFPEGFWKKVETVSKWSDSGKVYVVDGCLRSAMPDGDKMPGMVKDAPELKQNVAYEIAALKILAKHAQRFDDSSAPNALLFFGKQLRGAVFQEWLGECCPLCRYEVINGICQNFCCKLREHAALAKAHRYRLCSCGSGIRSVDCDCIPF